MTAPASPSGHATTPTTIADRPADIDIARDQRERAVRRTDSKYADHRGLCTGASPTEEEQELRDSVSPLLPSRVKAIAPEIATPRENNGTPCRYVNCSGRSGSASSRPSDRCPLTPGLVHGRFHFGRSRLNEFSDGLRLRPGT
jgi:hypothetical protein